MRLALSLPALSLSLAGFGCAADLADESPARTDAPLHSVPDADTSFPAVGLIHGDVDCTGVLIGPETVLTAAHCFASLARGCETLAEALRHTHFFLRNGTTSLHYGATDIRIAPGAYHAGTCADGDSYGLSLGHDLAVFRIKPDDGQKHADFYARPMDVATRVGWSTGNVSHFHGEVGYGGLYQFGLASDPVLPWMVGVGVRDQCDGPARRSGTASFGNGWDWFRDQDDGSYEIYTSRNGPTGAVVGPGDSGGPLVVLTGPESGSLHDGTAGLRLITGVISHGDPWTGQVPCNNTVPVGAPSWTAYSATFSPEMGAFLERALEDFWAVHYYPIELPFPRIPLPLRSF